MYTTTGFQELNKNSSKYDFDSQIWKYLLKHFGNNKEFYLLLKPHPLENSYTYKKILKENNFFNAKVVEDNLLELIYLKHALVQSMAKTK